MYTALDLTQVDYKADNQNAHQQFINMYDGSGEMETYRLVGQAPSAAVQGVGVTAYSSQGGGPVPVYQEVDDDDFYYYAMNGQSRMGQIATFYQANNLPLQVSALAGQVGNKMVLIIDD